MSSFIRLLYFSLVLFALPARAQVVLQENKGMVSSEIVLSGKVDYGQILAPAQALKLHIQDQMDTKYCKSGPYVCNEYPIGTVIGSKKYLMVNGQHPTVTYTDKKKTRSLQIPIEISREFPKTVVTGYDLLNKSTPGWTTGREFELGNKTLGDTLVSIKPYTNMIAADVCEIMPGTALINSHFAGTYTAFNSKFFKLDVDFSGSMGGFTFDYMTLCTQTQFHIQNNRVVSIMTDVAAPEFKNARKYDAKVKVSLPWVAIVIAALVLAAIFAFLPGVIGILLSVVFVVVAGVAAYIGIKASDFATKEVNERIDKAIEEYTGVSADDLNRGIDLRKQHYENLPIFKEKNLTQGDFQNGNWAYELLTKRLIRDHQLIAKASVEVSLEKYFDRYSIPTQAMLAPVCQEMHQRIIDRGKDMQLGTVDSVALAATALRIRDVCSQISASVKVDLFIPMPESQTAGCYDNFIRLEEVESRKYEVLTKLAAKLQYSTGSAYVNQVKAKVQERLNAPMMLHASNWWARQETEHYCGFDNRMTVSLKLPEETRFVSCFVREMKANNQGNNGLMGIVDRVVSKCNLQMKQLVKVR